MAASRIITSLFPLSDPEMIQRNVDLFHPIHPKLIVKAERL